MIERTYDWRRADLEAMRNSQPEQIISLYRNLCFQDGKRISLPYASFSSMIDAIIEDERRNVLQLAQVSRPGFTAST
ncbi:MAG TPA: hypothetical protein VGI40_09500 [Pirellulaceae bacterium]|jgi:hypothetical protein